MDRRIFLGSAAAAASFALASPNETVRVACVGFRARGKDHIKAYARGIQCLLAVVLLLQVVCLVRLFWGQ